METQQDLFGKIRRAIETNPNVTVCYFRTLHRELVNVHYKGHNNFKKALEELEQELRGDDEALFGVATGKGYDKGVQMIQFDELLSREEHDQKEGIVQRVELHVAPTSGLYLPDELQVFMMSLIPGITPTFTQAFEYGNEKLRLGKLGLYEKIGEMKRRIREEREETIIDSTFRSLLSDKIVNGQRRKEEDKEKMKEYHRVITLEVFPDVDVAKKLMREHADYISYYTLIESKPEIRPQIDEYVRSLHRE